ncbi:arginase [Bacillus sp. SORGH_AS 510]|nr:arginase [Bacillus sp. SORGH_AS_0510]
MTKKLSIIGMPMDLGQMRRGVDMGPSAIRYAGIYERLKPLFEEIHDLGDIPVGRPEVVVDKESNLRNLDLVAEKSTLLAEKVDEAVQSGAFPLVLGGDHSIAIGTLAGVSKHYKNLGVIWYDAHGDLNTAETSPTGNIHGMPLAVSLGWGHSLLTQILNYSPKVKPENVVIIGARALDDGEKELIKEKGIKVYTMHEIDRLGMTKVMEETISYLKEKNRWGSLVTRFRWIRSKRRSRSRYTGYGRNKLQRKSSCDGNARGSENYYFCRIRRSESHFR